MRKGGPFCCSANMNSGNTEKCSHTCFRATEPWWPVSPVRAYTLGVPQKGLGSGMKHYFYPIGKYVFQDEQRGCASDCQSIGICSTVSYLYMTEIGLVLSLRQRCWDVWLFFFGISFTKIMSKLYKTSNNLLGGQYVQRLCKCIYIESYEPYLLTLFSGPLKLINNHHYWYYNEYT